MGKRHDRHGDPVEVHIEHCPAPLLKGLRLPKDGKPGQHLVRTEDGVEWQDGKFLPLEGGGSIVGNDTINLFAGSPDSDGEISIWNSADDGALIRPGFMGVINKNGYGGYFQAEQDGLVFYDAATNGPVALLGLKAPERDDGAANKKYVDDIKAALNLRFFNFVSISETAMQEMKGTLSSRGLIVEEEEQNHFVNISPDAIILENWDGDMVAIVVLRTEITPDGIPALLVDDGGSGNNVVVRGINLPQQDNDATPKEYVDEADEKSTLRFAEQGGLHGVRGTTYNQMLSLLPNFFQKVDKAGSKNAALINEVNDPTFSDGSNSWTLEEGAEIVTGVGLIGNSSLFVHSTGLKASQVISGGEKRLTAGHVYYASAYFNRSKNSTGVGVSNLIQARMRIGENETVLGSQSGQVLPAAGDWVRRGFLFTVPEEEYDEITLCLGISGNPALAQKGTYIDGVVLLDLTNYWGAGNEPDYDWCKNYLPFFSYKNLASGYVYTPKQFATAQEVDTAINAAVGDIAAALDGINGEVV